MVATDLQCDFLEDLDEKNLEVRTHDIAADDLEEGAFDLVHSRMVLQHVPGRDQALKRMARALAPGGVLLEEDMDCASLVASGAGVALFERAVPPLIDILRAVGYDPDFGRRLPAALRMQGLAGVAAEGRVPVGVGRDAAAEMWRLSVERCRPALVARGDLTDDEVDQSVALHDDETFTFLYPIIVAAWADAPWGPFGAATSPSGSLRGATSAAENSASSTRCCKVPLCIRHGSAVNTFDLAFILDTRPSRMNTRLLPAAPRARSAVSPFRAVHSRTPTMCSG